ncbi:hypothetical protein [Carboxylicivirga marina]|uniref:hypothetical protein n=1 Tax=Carboxylicivirga marina TaxID=2800988 RepID=UPI0025993CB9|nr:hypothetical protein [uncultured Carboxylicivirga sp.]
MQEQKSKIEKIINTSIDEIKQKMHSICEKEYKKELDFDSAIGFIGKINLMWFYSSTLGSKI